MPFTLTLRSGEIMKRIPNCLAGDIDDASTTEEALALATTQADLIEEGQDGTEQYRKRDIVTIRNWVNSLQAKR